MQLQGQVALITGSGRGIGKAIALRFAQEGADIAIVDINRELAQTAGEDIKKLGRRVVVLNTDVSDWSWTESMRQIGNAVPVTLAEAVGQSVANALRRASNPSENEIPTERYA